MPSYNIQCDTDCGWKDEWTCTISEYESRIKGICPDCGNKIVQNIGEMNFILKGSGWAKGGICGKGHHKPGSQEDLDDAQRENDMFMNAESKNKTEVAKIVQKLKKDGVR